MNRKPVGSLWGGQCRHTIVTGKSNNRKNQRKFKKMEDFNKNVSCPVLPVKTVCPHFAGETPIVEISLHIKVVVLSCIKFKLNNQKDIYC